MLKSLFYILITINCFSAIANSETDPFNTYQFNRQNVLASNGQVDTTPWFEWWYYKVVLPEKNKSFYFVYGTVNPWDQNHQLPASRSYVGMGDFSQNLTLEELFSVSDFTASYVATDVKVGSSNLATDQQLTGSISDPMRGEAKWNIAIQKKWAFNATGWATGKSITNIEWYPAQADARCSGEVIINRVKEVFTNVPCYQDRNWGSLFPQWWTWIVSNHFEGSPDTSLAIGGGKPTILDHFNGIEGVTIGLKHKGREYAWRPHEGDFVKLDISFGHWEVEGRTKDFRIQVSANAPKNQFMDLQFMTPQGSVFHDYETLQGDVNVKLFKRSGDSLKWTLIANLISHHAGIEFGSFDILNQDSKIISLTK